MNVMNIKPSSQGVLFLVATPIGNKADITLRALDVLNKADLIAAEDTRHSKQLLQHYQIKTPLISLHEFNEKQRIPLILEYLLNGKTVALVSDAGTPLISDPGYALVKAASNSGLTVSPIPGACAAIAALCASGLPTNEFMFAGFLPTKPNARRQRLASLKNVGRPIIFYESPHRIVVCTHDIRDMLGVDREIVLAKEMTKTFETFFRGNAQQACDWLEQDTNHQKGEFVILIKGADVIQSSPVSAEALRILGLLEEALPSSQAIELTAKITGEKRNALKAAGFKRMAKK